MSKPTEHTTKFGVDISELKAGISQANRQIKLLNAEFKEASAGMDDWDKSTDGISAKLKQLNGVLKQQKSVLDNYEKQLEIIVEEQGENSKAADDLRVKILNQKAAVKKTEAQIGDYNERMQKAEKAQKKAAKSGKTVAEEFDNIDEEAEDAEKSVRSLSDGFTVMRGTIANLLADGIRNVISGIGNAISESQEWRKEMSYLEANANNANYGLGKMTKITKEVASVTGDAGAAVEGMSNIMATGMKDVQGIADGLAGAAIKWKDTLKFEGLADGLQETLAVGEATGSFGEMLERSGVSLEKWNKGLAKAIKNGTEENYILQTMADAGLYDVKEAYEEANGSMIKAARAELDFTDNMAKLAEKAEPIQTAVKQGFADILGVAARLLSDIDTTAIADKISGAFSWFINVSLPAIKTGVEWIIENVGGLISSIDWAAIGAALQGAFDWFINTAVPAIQTGFQWILDNKDALIAGFIAIAAAVGTYTAYTAAVNLLNGGWRNLAIVQKAVTAGQWLMNAAMNANPIGLVIAAVAALVAAFIYLWNNCEEFRQFWIDLWERIKKTAGDVAAWFSKTWEEISAWFSGMWEGFSKWASESWAAIQKTWQGVKTWFNNTVIAPVKSGFSTAWKNVSGWASESWKRIKDTYSGIKGWFSDKFGAAYDAIKDKFSGWGEFWSGLWTNIKNKFSDIGSNIGSSISDTMKSGLNRVLGSIEGVINKGIGLVNNAIDLANMLPGVSVGHVPTLSLPRLAQGGYIGPNRPTAAIIGDNKHAGEIVAPEDKLLEIMKRALTEFSTEGVAAYDPHGGTAATGAAGGRSMNFYQYNTSPKALSRLEIYRQTQNQLKAAAGVV